METRERLARHLVRTDPAQAARTLAALSVPAQLELLSLLAADSAPLFAHLPPTIAERCMVTCETDIASDIVATLAPRLAASVLRRLDPDLRDAILAEVPRGTSDLQRVLRYDEGMAGAHMEPRVSTLSADLTIGEALATLGESTEALTGIYAVDRERRLVGRVDPARLLRLPPSRPLREGLVVLEAISARTPVRVMMSHPSWAMWPELPIVDSTGALVGAIPYPTRVSLLRAATTSTTPASMEVALPMAEAFWTAGAALLEVVVGRTGGSSSQEGRP